MAEQDQGLDAVKNVGVPDMIVKVKPGVTIGHQGTNYTGGDTVRLEGPTAISLVQEGKVTIQETP